MPPRDAPPPIFPAETPEERARRLNYPGGQGGALPKILGAGGRERYQLWPERAIRDALTLTGDVMSGEEGIWDPFTGHTAESVLPRAFDAAGLGMTGGLVAGVGKPALGSGPLRPPPAATRVHAGIGGPGMDKTGWRAVDKSPPQAYTGYRDVDIFDADGNWRGSRSTGKSHDEILAEWGEPSKPSRRPAHRPTAVRITQEPEGSVPEVVWGQKDLQDSAAPTPATIMKDYGRGKGVVTQGFIDIDSLPKAKLSGGRDSYDWSELQSGRSEPPPVKIRINPNGSATILDGNHRIEFWREQGHDQVPAWIIDERSKPTTFDDTLTSGGRRGEAGIAAAAVSANQPLYSAAARVVQGLGMRQASAGQWLATLRNKGVRQEELEALGLTAMKPDQIVTYDDLVTLLDERLPTIQTVVRRDKYNPSEGMTREELLQNLSELEIVDEATLSRMDLPDLQAMWNSQLVDQTPRTNTKFSAHTLPGGENYREILYTLPEQNPPLEWRLYKLRTMKDGEVVEYPQEDFRTREEAEAAAALRGGQQLTYMDPRHRYGDNSYRSSHWDEPNVLAHARVEDRMLPSSLSPAEMAEWQRLHDLGRTEGIPSDQWDRFEELAHRAEGTRTLFIEEIQSDWHQAGRKHGYKGQLTGDGWTAVPASRGEGSWDIFQADGEPRYFLNAGEASTPQEAIQEAVRQLSDPRGYGTSVVPDAPFKTTWPEYVLKRLVDDAVRGGYDAVAWTDGATQAARYDLSKQIDSLEYDQGTHKLDAMKGGRTVISEIVGPEKLPDMIGKEASDRLLNKPSEVFTMDDGAKVHILSGVDLQVGGEGMKGFYDDMLPRMANRLYKRDGARVSDGSLDATRRDAMGRASSNPSETGQAQIHILRITPAMRERVLREGQPLFSAGAPGMGELSPRGRQHGQGPTTEEQDPRWQGWDNRTGA